MASLEKITRKSGNGYRIVLSNGNDRQRIYIGKMPKKAAELCLSMIERIAACNAANVSLDVETAAWLSNIGDELHGKLVNAGLIHGRNRLYLSEFINRYKDGKQWKTSSAAAFNKCEKHLIDFFGADIPIDKVTAEQAANFRIMLVKSGLAEATVAKRIMQSKAIFNEAKRQRLIPDSPFDGVKSGSQVNTKRMYFITIDEYNTLIEECTNYRQRLILTLCRFAGIRIGEIAGLRWSEIDWQKNRFTVHSPKTEGKGKDRRTVPLFPELQKFFREYFETLPEGADDLVFGTIIPYDRLFITKLAVRCGLGHIPKIPQNCRSTRATELIDTGYPAHIVNAWLGHTEAVAMAYYRQAGGKAADKWFEKASGTAKENFLEKKGKKRGTNPLEMG